MNNKIKILQNIIDSSKNIVFFGGAGVSTGSGIQDFRGQNGLYKEKYPYPPEYLLSHDCFNDNPQIFYDFYKKKMNCLNNEPNITHKFLKKLEDKGKLKGIITQNIDGLHQKAGNKNIFELHGSIYRNYCPKCHKFYDASYIFNCRDIPKCSCGEIIKPDVVLYGEQLPNDYLKAIEVIKKSDLLIVGGSSLTVEPASSMLTYFQGSNLVIINYDKTPYDYIANLVINADINEVFKKLKC